MIICILHKTDVFKDKLINIEGDVYQQNNSVYLFKKELNTESFFQNKEIAFLSNISPNSTDKQKKEQIIKYIKSIIRNYLYIFLTIFLLFLQMKKNNIFWEQEIKWE